MSDAHPGSAGPGGTPSAVEAVTRSFARMEAVGAGSSGLNIVLWSDRDAALRAAGTVDDRLAAGEAAGPLAGVPFATKDNIATLDLPTTCASRILEGYVSPYEATVVSRLRDAGAVQVAKTNMDEFAMGSSTEYSAYGPARNPVDPTRVPGGSSGGSAAAVAAGIVRIALGSETGGSVRQPASYCGVVGVKPTYGRVSRYGLVAFASSLDQVGVFGASVDDAALVMETIAGHDPRDSTSASVPVPRYRETAGGDLTGMVVGKPKEYFPESLDAGVAAACNRALDALVQCGAEVKEISLPHTSLAIPVYYIIAPAEASSNLARFDGVRYGLRVSGDGLRGMYEETRSCGFGPEVTRRILLGTYVLSAGYYDAYYLKAQKVRTLIRRDFDAAFSGPDGVDAIMCPTSPTPAFLLGEKTSDPLSMYLSDVYTLPASLAGLPAISVPCAPTKAGLPVGLQIIAPALRETTMFTLASAWESAHR
jgi:aspartyl-tRNA(Asn)/glutamyl-tRNA(Gln) amidotransferase subunit A